MSSYFNKKKTSKDIIINWYTKQNAVGNQKMRDWAGSKKRGSGNVIK